MANAPYEHVESPCTIVLDGARAFNIGDAVPIETARRIGLLNEFPDLKVVEAREVDPNAANVSFRDVPIVVDDGASASSPAPAEEETKSRARSSSRSSTTTQDKE